MYRKFLKRLFDFFLSLFLIIVLIPFFLIIALFVRFKIDRKIFFIQERPGLNSKIFKIYKFKTMSEEKDKNENLLPDELRLSKFGKIIRKFGIDELPQLFNILKGDMSFVGPRPLLVEYLPLYNNFESRRHEVRPGITGLAQINGRNLLTWDQKFAYDIEYVDNLNFISDIKILFLTFKKIFKEDHNIAEKFNPKRTIYIYGAGGHGLVLADIAISNGYTELIFLDDYKFDDKNILKFNENLPKFDMIIGIGNNKIRQILQYKCEKLGFNIVNLIHKNAFVSPSVVMGKGIAIMPNAVINANCKIGDGAIINSCAIVEHECDIGRFVHISVNCALSGLVKVGELSFVGLGSSVINNIGKNTIIGAGSVVVKEMPDNIKAYGNPAIKRGKNE